MTLYFDGLPAGQVEIAGRLEGAGSRKGEFEQSFAWTAIEEPRGLVYSDSRWQRRPPETGETFTGFRIWNVGERGGEIVVPDNDPEMIRQLRALGYVQ